MQRKMLSAFFREAVRIVVLLIVGSSPTPAAEGAQTFREVTSLLHDSREFRVDLELSKCLIKGTDKRAQSVRAGFRFDAFMSQGDESVSFSMTHFSVRIDKTPVTEFLSFKVWPSGRVDVRSIFLNAVTLTIFHESEFECNLGEGVVLR